MKKHQGLKKVAEFRISLLDQLRYQIKHMQALRNEFDTSTSPSDRREIYHSMMETLDRIENLEERIRQGEA